MATLRGHGLQIDLPPGWEGQIFRRGSVTAAQTHAVLHAANFAMPPQRGDFGSGAVDVMGPGHMFCAMFEHGPDAAGTPLFNRGRRPLRPNDFNPNGLQRALPGQSGTQQFFSQNDRAFILYAVLGSHALRFSLTPALNALLDAVEVEAHGSHPVTR